MNNAYEPAFPMLKIYADGTSAIKQEGLTKLEYAVIQILASMSTHVREGYEHMAVQKAKQLARMVFEEQEAGG